MGKHLVVPANVPLAKDYLGKTSRSLGLYSVERCHVSASVTNGRRHPTADHPTEQARINFLVVGRLGVDHLPSAAHVRLTS
jgi:hypothetical protein